MSDLAKSFAIALAVILIDALLVMLFWNALLPDLFKAKEISYLQSLLLLLFIRTLFFSVKIPKNDN